MNNIVKRNPNYQIIQILSEQITEIGIPLLKNLNSGKISFSVFDSFTSNYIPTKEFSDNRGSMISDLTGSCRISMNTENSKQINTVMNILNANECTNTIIYPKNSMMKWHTNKDNPGKRIYITFSKTPGIFRYIDQKTNQIVDDYDYEGWTQREFFVNQETPLWHCVWASSIRFSFGFNIK